LVQGQETAGQLTVVGRLGCLHPQQVKDLRERQTRPAAAAGGLQHRSASSSGGPCDGALGDGGQPVAIWVRLDQLAAGDDEPPAGADDPGSGEQAVAEDRCKHIDGVAGGQDNEAGHRAEQAAEG
jgi:hypothetical protein